MEEPDSPYVYRDEVPSGPAPERPETEVIIVDGRAMSYRWYRR